MFSFHLTELEEEKKKAHSRIKPKLEFKKHSNFFSWIWNATGWNRMQLTMVFASVICLFKKKLSQTGNQKGPISNLPDWTLRAVGTERPSGFAPPEKCSQNQLTWDTTYLHVGAQVKIREDKGSGWGNSAFMSTGFSLLSFFCGCRKFPVFVRIVLL